MNDQLESAGKTGNVPAAITEVFAVCTIYIAFAHFAVAKDLFGAAAWFNGFSPAESEVAAGFTSGALAQLALVAALVFLPMFPHARQAVRTLLQPAASNGWTIALSVLVVEVLALYLGWIKDIGRLADTSLFGVSMSFVPALDGLTQEIVFRGYVILRLAAGGASRSVQILVSAVLFAAIHYTYVANIDGSSLGSMLLSFMPIVGTFGLGAAWAFAFQQSGYKLLPVVASHVLVVILVQPWLAMSYSL